MLCQNVHDMEKVPARVRKDTASPCRVLFHAVVSANASARQEVISSEVPMGLLQTINFSFTSFPPSLRRKAPPSKRAAGARSLVWPAHKKKPPFGGPCRHAFCQRSMKFSEREMMHPTSFSSFSPMLFALWHFF